MSISFNFSVIFCFIALKSIDHFGCSNIYVIKPWAHLHYVFFIFDVLYCPNILYRRTCYNLNFFFQKPDLVQEFYKYS